MRADRQGYERVEGTRSRNARRRGRLREMQVSEVVCSSSAVLLSTHHHENNLESELHRPVFARESLPEP